MPRKMLKPPANRAFRRSAAPWIDAFESRRMLSAATMSLPPRYDHVVVVVEENHSYDPILGRAKLRPTERDPYIRNLAATGAIFTQSQAITHPSEPNYLALISGSTQGVTDDSAPSSPFPAPSLGGELLGAGNTFACYSESMPQTGYAGGDVGNYVRHHNPTVDFPDIPPADNRPFSDFPRRFSSLPTVSFVVPNVVDDMHSGTVIAADRWLKKNLGIYVRWARTHNSLLIVTWDEGGAGDSQNHVPTFFVGARVRRGHYAEPINHFNVLRTIEGMYGVASLAETGGVNPIIDVFRG